MRRPDQFRADPPSDPEAGYLLVGVVVMTALVLIALSVAVPVIAKDLRRQKELESQHRAEQYVRAIRLYYRKTKAYPPSIDALKSTNNVRFLRQEYVDPLTGKSDWRIIHLGEQKTTVKGFFGQELGGLNAGGTGSSLGTGLGSAAGMSSGFGSSSTSTIGATSPLASGFSGASTTTSTPGTTGLGGSGLGSTAGTSATAGLTGSSGATGSSGSTGSGGLGGGGAIIGVGPAATGDSISTPNQQTAYDAWEFWYDPRIEQLYQKGKMNSGMGSGALGSKSASSFGTDINGKSNSPTSSSPFSSSPTSTSPSSPSTTSPQQP